MYGNNRKAAPAYENAQTAVWWDMETCPIPDGYDPRWVRPSIESVLKDLGYHGPVTITARSNCEQTPAHVRQALSSTGIVVKHSFSDRVPSFIYSDLVIWKRHNPPPATIMLISDRVELGLSSFLCLDQQSRSGYNFVLAYTNEPSKQRLLYVTAEWLWKTILAADKQETRRFALQKCSESDESGSFLCQSCFIPLLSVSDFTSHLSSEEHKQEELSIIEYRMTRYDDVQPTAKVELPPKSKRLRIAFRTTPVLLLTKRRPRRRGPRCSA